jgi:hypothetical protein
MFVGNGRQNIVYNCKIIFVNWFRVERFLVILGVFVKSWKATISFVWSVFVRMEQLDCHWADFHQIWYLRRFRKSIERVQISLGSNKNSGYFICRSIHILIISRSVLLRMRNISEKSCRENQNTHFVFNNIFFRQTCRLWNNLEIFCRAGQAIDEKMANLHFMLRA